MQIAPGVFVSRTDTDEWQPDHEVGGEAHILFEEGETVAGLWRTGDGVVTTSPVTIPARETILVLAGSVRVRVDDADPRPARQQGS